MSAFKSTPVAMKLSSELASLYAANPAKFQRLVGHLMVPRFKIHRLYIDDVSQSAYIDTIGDVVIFRNEKLKFPTLHDWYNHVKGTQHSPKDLSIFNHIRLSKRVSVASLFTIVEKSEITEFRDMKFRAMGLYTHVYRQLKTRQLALPWSRDYSFDVSWKDQKYVIDYGYVKDDKGRMALDLLDAFETNQLADLYWKDETGCVWALTDSVLPPEPEPERPCPTPPVPHTEVETSMRLQILEDNTRWLIETVQHLGEQRDQLMATVQQLNTDHENMKNMLQQQRSIILSMFGILQNLQIANNIPVLGPLVLPLK